MSMLASSTEQEDLNKAWRRIGDVLIGGHFTLAASQQRMEGDISVLKTDVSVLKTDVAVLKTDVAVLKTDVAELKTDVAELKTDMKEVKAQLTRHELATERGFQKVDAQFERLTALIIRDETRR